MNQGGETIATETACCRKCGEAKPRSEFDRDKRSSTGFKSQCKSCAREYKRELYKKNPEYAKKCRENCKAWAEANPEKKREGFRSWVEANPDRAKTSFRRSLLKRRYGITIEQYESAIGKQGGLCANKGCDRPASVIDHCHDTMIVRGVLCNGCNSALGFIDEDIQRLLGLIDYILEA